MLRKPFRKLISLLALLLVGGLFWHLAVAHASFNPNNLMDNTVFDDAGSMDGPTIDAWLNNNFPQSCISTNNHFSDAEPTGYTPSSGFTYNGVVSAGTIIATSAHVYGLNPKVILATLEKESSVVSGTASYHCQYLNTAMGFDCPDSGSCPQNPATESGFAKQVIHAVWVLKFHEQRSMGRVGWDVQLTNYPHPGDNWDNSDDPQSCYGGRMTQGTFARCPSQAAAQYDGLTTIDGTTVHLDTGATAALYDYTPHFHGNQLFDSIFIGWFGSIYASPYTAEQVSQSAYPQLNPGQSATVFVKFQNVGAYDWYDDAAGATNVPLVHLATAHPLNRPSSFNQGWISTSRPATVFAAVYEGDGTTLAGNQHMVRPGQIAKFQFSLTAPTNLGTGVYREFFQPVAEGVGNGGFNDVSTFFDVTVNAKPAMAWYDQSAYPTVYPATKAAAYLRFQNTGNTIFYDDVGLSQAPSGTLPLHLATKSPLNRNSDFSADWPSPSRPALVFAAVYNPDGSLTDNQHAAGPGQIVKFSFNFTAPEGYAAGTYREDFQPVLEGTSDGGLPSVGGFLNVTVPTAAVITYTSLPNPAASLVSNVPGTVGFTIKNSGNTTLAANTQLVTSTSSFRHSSWASNTVIMSTIGSSLGSLQTRNISFTVQPPDFVTSAVTPLNISFQDQSNATIPNSPALVNISVAGATYQSGNVNQSAYPSFTYGQTQTAFFEYQNTGNQYWYDDTGLAGATTGAAQVIHLATGDPLNRNSGLDKDWPSPNRPAVNFSAVYESNGTTLASNQHAAAPGQIVKFQFTITPSVNVPPGTYREFFQPIVESTADGRFPKPWTFLDVTILNPTYQTAQVSQSAYPTLNRGQQTQAYINFKNNGAAPWYDENARSQAPSNAYVVHLATSHTLNRASWFSQGWVSTSRPALNFAAVYESDGTTLASNQDIAQPGQIVKFSFPLTVPGDVPSGSYREFFQPVAEGTADGAFNDVWTSFVITVN